MIVRGNHISPLRNYVNKKLSIQSQVPKIFNNGTIFSIKFALLEKLNGLTDRRPQKRFTIGCGCAY